MPRYITNRTETLAESIKETLGSTIHTDQQVNDLAGIEDERRPLWFSVLPIQLYSPNRQVHWGKRRAWNIEAETEIVKAWKEKPFTPTLPLEVYLIRLSCFQFDYDNYVTSLKHARDTVANLLIPGLPPGKADGSNQIDWHYQQYKGKSREHNLLIALYNRV